MSPALRSAETILLNCLVVGPGGMESPDMALALGQGEILAVGPKEEITAWSGPGTEVIDLGGRLVTPGFIDTHIHFYEWAVKRQGLKLEGLTRLEELVAMVEKAERELPDGQWIMGQGWNETDWERPIMPARDILDRAAPGHPVLLWRCDLHLAAANSRALELAGIGPNTSDPPEGRIERDQKGKPTGILRELAVNLVRQAVAEPDAAFLSQAFGEAAAALHKRGVTGIHDVRLMADRDGGAALRTFQRLEQKGLLQLRTWVTLPGDRLESIIDLGLMSGIGGPRLKLGHVKYFSDGGMGARTAWMIDPFLDAGRGMPLMDMSELARDIIKADDAGLSVMVHAVGDRANRELIDIFERVWARRLSKGLPGPEIPHRIEHVQMLRPEDAKRLSRLDLALCVTPANMLLDINLIDRAVGEKGKWAYPLRAIFDTNAPVMFSSDCPVCDPAPLIGIHAAVARQRADGTPPGGWHPHNRVSVAEALDAYTINPARVHRADSLGAIAPGKMADLVVLSHDILRMPPEQLPDARVDMTIFNGQVVYHGD